MGSMNQNVVFVVLFVALSGTGGHKQNQLKVNGDALSSHDHGEGHNHNPEYDHEAFLGKDEAQEYVFLSPEESKKKLGALFPKVDAQETSDGFVTKEELRKWMRGQQTRYLNRQQESKLNATDANGDGAISWEEHENETYGFLRDSETGKEDAGHYDAMAARDKRRFRVADVNGDGKLMGEEVGAFINPEHYQHMHDSVITETMEYIDKDKDGFISFKEFIDDVTPEGETDKNDDDEEKWIVNERKKFTEHQDKDKDGKLDEEEVRLWVLPDPTQQIAREADHLLGEADVDKDGKISKKEMVEKYDVFVGSTSSIEYTHDEL